MRILLVSVLLCMLLAASASAATITFTLDGVEVAGCYHIWHERGQDLWFDETTAEDYLGAGFCLYNLGIEPTAPALLGGRLYLWFPGITGVETVEIDIDDVSDAGRTRAFVYSFGGAVLVNQVQGSGGVVETLMLNAAGASVDLVAISGDEVLVHEIRLIGDNVVATEDRSWSAIKALF